MENRTEIIVEDGKEKKALILSVEGWAKFEANPDEREWIKLMASKQGYEIIRYNKKDLWRRDGRYTR